MPTGIQASGITAAANADLVVTIALDVLAARLARLHPEEDPGTLLALSSTALNRDAGSNHRGLT